MKKKILLFVLVIVVGIQFIPVQRTNPRVVYDFNGPAEVEAILRRSCYDCHSYETEWPWYSYVAPVSWLVVHDVEEGREHLNFSEWEALQNMVWIHSKIHAEVAEGKMPMEIYLLMHSDAKVTEDELRILKEWAAF